MHGKNKRRRDGRKRERKDRRYERKEEATISTQDVLKILTVERTIYEAQVHEKRSGLKNQGRSLGKAGEK